MENEIATPRKRARQIGREALERRLRQTMAEGALSHGWIVSGPAGAGKATLAFRIARALLEPQALKDEDSLQMEESVRTFRLIASGAHPDLFVAERLLDEKKGKYQAEITVETIRKLTGFLNRTASGGGARVAIVDTANDMNRNAANALLKVLEEPPAGAILLLLSASPGRLLATIRSRCRTIELPPLSDEQVIGFLTDEGVEKNTAETVTPFAKGRPGYALYLAMGEGAEAIKLGQSFLKAAAKDGDISRIIAGVTGKAGEERWPIFRDTVLSSLSDAARATARGEGAAVLPDAEAASLLAAWEALSVLVARGEGLNLDRSQLLHAMAYDLRAALRQEAA